MRPATLRLPSSAILYGLIVFIAAALRFWNLTEIPHTLWADEAWFGLRGRDVIRGIDLLPLREPTSLGVGNSPFQIYASGFVQALGVPAAYSSRAASALTGWLTVVILYPALLILFKNLLPATQRVGAALIGAVVTTTLFAGLHYSRDGGQNAACTFATVGVFASLHSTFERSSPKWAIATGVALAVALSTYEAAAALVIAVIAYAGARLLWPADQPRSRILLLGAITLGAALLAYSPLLVFYLRRPEVYFLHFTQTQTAKDGALTTFIAEALAGLWKVWAGVSLSGDVMPGRNLAGRPLFGPISSILLWLGIIAVVWRMRRLPAAQLLLIWIGVMSLPSALSDAPPAFPRMLPMAPGLAAFAGMGAAAVWQTVSHRGRQARWAVGALLALGLIADGFSSIRAYFVEWANDPRLFDARYAGARLTADNALALAATDDVFITTQSQEFVRMQFDLLLGGASVKTFDAAPDCLPFANNSSRATDYGIILVFDRSSLAALKAAYPTGMETATVMHPDGYPYSLFLQVPPHTLAPSPTHTINVEFDGGLRLMGYDLITDAHPGSDVALKLYWEAASGLPGGLIAFVHIGKGANSQPLIAQMDAPLCPGFDSSEWQAGYRYIETRHLALAADSPPDAYDIRIGVYDPTLGARLNILSANVPTENNRAQIANLDVR